MLLSASVWGLCCQADPVYADTNMFYTPLVLQADLGGGDTRQIMAGLQQFLTPQQLQVGTQSMGCGVGWGGVGWGGGGGGWGWGGVG
jgi:hypothetical protein